MAEEEIRVGLIGAGGNVRNRHIPGFQKVAGSSGMARSIKKTSGATPHITGSD